MYIVNGIVAAFCLYGAFTSAEQGRFGFFMLNMTFAGINVYYFLGGT